MFYLRPVVPPCIVERTVCSEIMFLFDMAKPVKGNTGSEKMKDIYKLARKHKHKTFGIF